MSTVALFAVTVLEHCTYLCICFIEIMMRLNIYECMTIWFAKSQLTDMVNLYKISVCPTCYAVEVPNVADRIRCSVEPAA